MVLKASSDDREVAADLADDDTWDSVAVFHGGVRARRLCGGWFAGKTGASSVFGLRGLCLVACSPEDQPSYSQIAVTVNPDFAEEVRIEKGEKAILSFRDGVFSSILQTARALPQEYKEHCILPANVLSSP